MLEAFGSAAGMVRQGEVTDLFSAQRHVEWLTQERNRHSWAVDLEGRPRGWRQRSPTTR